MNETEKILLGHGRLQSLQPIPCLNPWKGVSKVIVPFDPIQARLNRRLYPELLGGED